MEGAERDGVTVFRGGEQSGDRAGNVEWLSEGTCCAMGGCDMGKDTARALASAQHRVGRRTGQLLLSTS